VLGATGIGLRQIDRLWFAARRREGEPVSVAAILEYQRSRANNVTPTLLLAGHWLEILAWWGLGARLGPAFLVVTAVMTAVKFRHLQETSHFAAHGVLFQSLRTGDTVTDLAVHAPLGYLPTTARRERHVRRHHPNAAVPGADPNLDDLERAGIRPGASRWQFIAGVLYPLAPHGILDTLRGIVRDLRMGAAAPWHTVIFAFAAGVAYEVGGLPVLLGGYLIPRLLIFPQLAWLSLLVEHTWFESLPDGDDLSRIDLEAGRCIRLYRHRALAELLARCLWLPYGDLYHFAHSAHPSVRWNYLRRVDESLGGPGRVTDHVVFGPQSVLSNLYRVTVRNIARQRPSEPAHSRI
jgi:fatty acid desaturase